MVDMAPMTWLTLLGRDLAMADEFAGELDRQLRDQARTLAGIELSSGRFALMPPDDGFTVRFRTVADRVVGVIEGYLVDPSASGHPVALGWRSRGVPGRRVEPGEPPGDAEFFWLQLPIAELSAGTRLDTSEAARAISAAFPVAWDLHDPTSAYLHWRTRRALTGEEQAGLASAIGDATQAWNAREARKLHYVGDPRVSPDGAEIGFYVDLGSAGTDALVTLVNAVASSPVAALITGARIGNDSAPV
jgi:hypothetical protein